jgi:hypothetical protein
VPKLAARPDGTYRSLLVGFPITPSCEPHDEPPQPADGADGVYRFNFFMAPEWNRGAFEPPFEVVKEVGDERAVPKRPRTQARPCIVACDGRQLAPGAAAKDLLQGFKANGNNGEIGIMSSPRFLSWGHLVLVALPLAPPAPLRAADGPPRPTVLFLFADDQRADTIGALGNSVIQTPNLDRLVKRGVAFDRAYMQGGLQGATCVPSRAMLLSGRPLFRVDEKLTRDPTWPGAFGKSGYTTFISGKWHNGPDSIPASFQIGRPIFAGGMTNPLQARLSDMVDEKLGKPQLAPKHACEVFADEAVRFLKVHKGGPFFCYVAFDAPHDPHVVPEGFPVKYDAARIPLPPNFLPQHPWDNGEMTVRD